MKISKEDKDWSAAVKILASKRCEWCGSVNNLQSHHIYSRRHKSTRYDIRNGVCLCAGCHLKAHHRPMDFSMWVSNKRGLDLIHALMIKSRLVKQDVSLDILNCKNVISNDGYKNERTRAWQ